MGSILGLMTVWKIRGKIIRTAVTVPYQVFLQKLNFLFYYCKGWTVLCVYVCTAWKNHPQNDLYCVRWDIKTYSLTHSMTRTNYTCSQKMQEIRKATTQRLTFKRIRGMQMLAMTRYTNW